jgi:hypothetical protein
MSAHHGQICCIEIQIKTFNHRADSLAAKIIAEKAATAQTFERFDST